jgi:hypothetical protein
MSFCALGLGGILLAAICAQFAALMGSLSVPTPSRKRLDRFPMAKSSDAPAALLVVLKQEPLLRDRKPRMPEPSLQAMWSSLGFPAMSEL